MRDPTRVIYDHVVRFVKTFFYRVFSLGSGAEDEEGDVVLDLTAESEEEASSSTAHPTTSTTLTSTTTGRAPTTSRKADRRFSVQGFKNFMPAAAISAAAFSLPMLVGRRKRQYNYQEEEEEEPVYDADAWQVHEEEDDAFVRHFTQENEREMREKDIVASSCRQLSVDENDGSTGTTLHHLLVCPGRQSRTLNMIVLDGLTQRRR